MVSQAPGQIRGPLPSEAERRGYSFSRALAFQQRAIEPDAAKYERHVSQHLRQVYGDMIHGDQSTMLVPFGSDMIPDVSDDAFRLSQELSQTIPASVRGADPGELSHSLRQVGHPSHQQTLSWFDDSSLGVFAAGSTMGELIQLVRNREVFSRAGSSQVTLPPNGRLSFPKQMGAGTSYWVGENTPITESEQDTGSINLIAKKLAALTKMPNELVRFGNPSVEAFIRNDLSRVMSLKADRDMLDGVGSTIAVKGLLTYAGIQTHVASTTDTDGDTFEPEDIFKVQELIDSANHDSDQGTWAMRPSLWRQLLNRRADAVTADDGAGPWLFPLTRDDVRAGMPSRLGGSPIVRSNQISASREKGASSDLTYALFGVFENWLVGRAGVLEFSTSTTGDTAFVNDQTWLRVIQHLDCAPRHEDAFCLIDDLDAS